MTPVTQVGAWIINPIIDRLRPLICEPIYSARCGHFTL